MKEKENKESSKLSTRNASQGKWLCNEGQKKGKGRRHTEATLGETNRQKKTRNQKSPIL